MAEPVPPRSGISAAPTGTRRSRLLVIVQAALAVLVGAAVWIWDDVFLAAPIAVATRFMGPWTAFVLLAAVYAVAEFLISLLAVRIYDRASHGRPSRLEEWLQRQAKSRRGRWGSRILGAGKVLGFALASFMLGAIVTTWLIRYGGRRDGIVGIAATSSVICGITFVGMYAGIFGLVFA